MKSFNNTRVEFHILQSFPVSCLNRDDVGSPKSAYIGGVPRARVSSQCWKRAVRLKLHEDGVKLGLRTKKLKDLLLKGLTDVGAEATKAEKCAETMAGLLTDDALIFVSDNEVKAFCKYAQDLEFDESKIKDKDLAKVAKKVINPGIEALDIALFGRMVAKVPEMNIEAAASFSHAISTHRVDTEIDFFTALDDLGEEQGSSHMGTLEFNSATYYRYVSLDLGQLAQTLGGEDGTADPEQIKTAVEAFIKALVLAVPAARQKTQAAYSVWDYARVLVRQGQPLQASFEAPIKANEVKGSGYLARSRELLNTQLDDKEKLLGSLFGKQGDFKWGEDTSYSIDNLIADVKKCLD